MLKVQKIILKASPVGHPTAVSTFNLVALAPRLKREENNTQCTEAVRMN